MPSPAAAPSSLSSDPVERGATRADRDRRGPMRPRGETPAGEPRRWRKNRRRQNGSRGDSSTTFDESEHTGRAGWWKGGEQSFDALVRRLVPSFVVLAGTLLPLGLMQNEDDPKARNPDPVADFGRTETRPRTPALPGVLGRRRRLCSRQNLGRFHIAVPVPGTTALMRAKRVPLMRP